MLGEVLGGMKQATLEDLFDRGYYLDKADVAYAKELSGKKLKDLAKPDAPVVAAVEECLNSCVRPIRVCWKGR
jgi:hypothetical protein